MSHSYSSNADIASAINVSVFEVIAKVKRLGGINDQQKQVFFHTICQCVVSDLMPSYKATHQSL